MLTQRSRGNDTISVRCAAGFDVDDHQACRSAHPARATEFPNAFCCVGFLTNDRVSEPRSRKFSPFGGAAAGDELDARDAVDLLVDELVDADDGAGHRDRGDDQRDHVAPGEGAQRRTSRFHVEEESYREPPAGPGRAALPSSAVSLLAPPLVAADSGPPDRSASPVVLRTAGGWIAAADPVEVVAATGPEAFARARHADAGVVGRLPRATTSGGRSSGSRPGSSTTSASPTCSWPATRPAP